MTDTGDRAELLRRFRSVMDGAEVADLRRLAGDLALFARDSVDDARPRLRRPPLEEVSVFRVRADLAGARPPIWRRVELRSDLTLDRIHEVLQAGFEWTDSHLHRFSIGGDPFDRASELFLCPWDVEEGDDEGTPDQPGPPRRKDPAARRGPPLRLRLRRLLGRHPPPGSPHPSRRLDAAGTVHHRSR